MRVYSGIENVCNRPGGSPLARVDQSSPQEVTLRARHYDDDWTIESWRIEPRLRPLDGTDHETESNPPLWKDLTLASIIAALLWGTAALMLS